jgi:hypothetical protein
MAIETTRPPTSSPLADTQASPPLPGGASPAPAEMGGKLQDLLPEIQALAKKCGGLDKLAEIVGNLRTAKPV